MAIQGMRTITLSMEIPGITGMLAEMGGTEAEMEGVSAGLR
jgi:hypothetical protein